MKTKFITLRKDRILTKGPFDSDTLEVTLSLQERTLLYLGCGLTLFFPKVHLLGIWSLVIKGSRHFKRQGLAGLATPHSSPPPSQYNFLSHYIISLLF